MKASEIIATIIMWALIAWVVVSFINVDAHNLTDQIYADWNFFKIFFF